MSIELFCDPMYRRFACERTIATISQLTLRKLLDVAAVNQVFRDNAEAQYERRLSFGALANLMSAIVLGKYASVNAGYKKVKDELGVSLYAVY